MTSNMMNNKAGGKFDLKLLKNPPPECAVSYGWIWNEHITKEGIDAQLKEFTRAGIKSLYVLPLSKDFHPNRLRTFISPDYLTDEFFSLVEYAIRKCVKLGIVPWIYDEGGWPSGAGGLKTVRQFPDAVTKLLIKSSLELKEGEVYTGEDHFIALFDGKERLSLPYTAERDITLSLYTWQLNDRTSFFVDFTNPGVIDTFLNNTHEEYKKAVGDLFGRKLPLIFTDEPGLISNAIPDRLFEIFEEKYGYDLKDYVYVITDLGAMAETDAEHKARIDFIKLRGELFLTNTFDKISEWCEKNGVYYSGHVMADNYPHACNFGYFSILDSLKRLHVPGIDTIWEQIRVPYDNRVPYDLEETEKMPFFPRLAQSAARQMGRNLALTETYSIYGEGISPDEMRYVSNYQAVRGINVFNFLNLPYGKSRCSALMMRPGFCPEKPGFYNLAHINEYYARLSYLTRLGYAEGDTALYHPTHDYAAGGKVCDDAIAAFRDAGNMLEIENIAFDLIDDRAIRDAKIEDGGLKIGYALYRHIVVPENKYMPEDVKEKIAPYVGKGAPTYTFKNEKVRVLTRKLDTGRLWFIFNEGIETAREHLDIAEGKKAYRINVNNGEIYESDCNMELICGDMAVYYVTDDALPTVSDEAEARISIKDLRPISYKQLVIEYEGLTNVYGDGMPELDKTFSGEILYRGTYEFDKAPKAKERYRIVLDGFSVTARVRIGKFEATVGMSPMSVTVPGRYLKKQGEIEITVANTAADEIVAKRELIHMHPIAELNPMYQQKMRVFEEAACGLKIGEAYIEKLI